MSSLIASFFKKELFYAILNLFGFIFIGAGLFMLLLFGLSFVAPDNPALNEEPLLFLGIFFIIFGSPFPLLTFLLTRKESRLKKHGKVVKARLESAIKEENGNRYRLYLIYQEDGSKIEYRMVSPYLIFNPNPYIDRNEITHFEVLIDPDNPECYYIDRQKLLFLEGEA